MAHTTPTQPAKTTNRQAPRTREGRIEEARLYRWLVTQRLLADVDALRPDRRAALDARLPGWNFRIKPEDLDHAVSVVDPELNEALTIWFNAKGFHPTPLTFEDILELPGWED